MNNGKKYRVVFWGTYDTGKPRVRILLCGLKATGVEIIECHSHVWKGVEDKSQIKGIFRKIYYGIKWLFAYPKLLIKYIFLPRHDAVVVPYMGQLDVILLKPLAKLRRVPLIWDAFISLYETVVEDRKLISKKSPAAKLLYLWEWFACRVSDKIILETFSLAEYFEKKYKLKPGKTARVLMGVETDIFFEIKVTPKESHEQKRIYTIFYFGQFIPHHGLDVIIEAAEIAERRSLPVIWQLAGEGQEKQRIQKIIREKELKSIKMLDWIPYNQLFEYINHADICLGIFGISEKGDKVVTNKIYQILACRRPVITAATSGIEEFQHEFAFPNIYAIPPGNPQALTDKISELIENKQELHYDFDISIITTQSVGRQLKDVLDKTIIKKK